MELIYSLSGLHDKYTLCTLGTPKRVLWQTANIQMKCSIMLHFIRFALFARIKTTFRVRNPSTYKLGLMILVFFIIEN